MKQELYQKDKAIDFYQERYQKGYMDNWPVAKKQRVFEIIRKLPLPATGKALDYGCGNGIFTDLLRQALPGWEVYGSDISAHAVSNAKERFPECTFFVSDNDQKSELVVDFLFSHHVLEHVFDIEKAMVEINQYLKPTAFILHILPCGNPGSLEYELCSWRRGGIDPKMQNRFFFEDEGHVRRLTTTDLEKLINNHQFTLTKAFYSNQYHGAIKWMSQSDAAFIKTLTDPHLANSPNAKRRLTQLRRKLLFLFALQRPYILFRSIREIPQKGLKHHLAALIYLVPSLFSFAFYRWVEGRAESEWKHCNGHKNGSEMYVFFSRKP